MRGSDVSSRGAPLAADERRDHGPGPVLDRVGQQLGRRQRAGLLGRIDVDGDVEQPVGQADARDPAEVVRAVGIEVDDLVARLERRAAVDVQLVDREAPQPVDLLLRQEGGVGHAVGLEVVGHGGHEKLGQAQHGDGEEGDADQHLDQAEAAVPLGRLHVRSSFVWRSGWSRP